MSEQDIFELFDKTGRKIRLTKKQWTHIQQDHPDITEEQIKEALLKPIKITKEYKNKMFYYRNFEQRKQKNKFLRVIVKYLNGDGFIITAYFVSRT